ncbi:MAG: hypothetical protein GY788_06305 [bacterium]|nr:hypothetical protein [bacterium]
MARSFRIFTTSERTQTHLPDAENPGCALDAATGGGGLAIAEPEVLTAPCVVAFPGV